MLFLFMASTSVLPESINFLHVKALRNNNKLNGSCNIVLLSEHPVLRVLGEKWWLILALIKKTCSIWSMLFNSRVFGYFFRFGCLFKLVIKIPVYSCDLSVLSGWIFIWYMFFFHVRVLFSHGLWRFVDGR